MTGTQLRIPTIRLGTALGGAIVLAVALTGCGGGSGLTSSPPDPNLAATSTNIASLTEVIQRNPNDPQAYNVRGAVLGRAGRNEDALADFNKAVSINPSFAQAYANRGLVYRQMKKFDLALADYNKAIELDPAYSPAYLGRGMVYRSQGNAMQALGDFNKSMEL